MDVREYRKNYEAELAKRAQATPDAPAQANLADKIRGLLATLRNPQEAAAARSSALDALKAAGFLGPRFAPFKAEFLASLREIAQPNNDPKLRERALETLAQEKDPQAQALLRRGLTEPQTALVSPAKALQFLSYDDHAGIADLARDIFQKATDLATKEEALRALASDVRSAGLFADLLKDKAQPRSIRALSATALHHVDPKAFAEAARAIVPDNHDYDDIRATLIGALAHAVEPQNLPKDADFLRTIEDLGAKTTSANIRSAVGRLVQKLRP